MARKKETREVEVKYCDFCGEETEHLERCAVCKREMCNKDGGKAHSTHSLEIYRYRDGQRISPLAGKICKDCSGKKVDVTIGELLDGMMEESPVPTTGE